MTERPMLAQEAPPAIPKRTINWGEQQAKLLWDNTLSKFPFGWRGKVALDFGCSWGYLAKLLIEQQQVAECYGIDIIPHWQDMEDGSTPQEIEGLHLYAGNILEIPELQPIFFDIIFTSGTLFLLEPSHLRDVVNWFYNHLKPGGYGILRTRTFLSAFGADIHHDINRRGVHLVFSRRTYDAYLKNKGALLSRQISPFCGATYLMLYARAGFEILDVRRNKNRLLDQDLVDMFPDRFALYEPKELATSDVIAFVRKPERPRSFTAFDNWPEQSDVCPRR